MTIDSSVSKRVAMLRTILIMLVVLLHIGTPELSQINYGDPLELVRFFFQNELGRLAVPTLTMISGYLLYSSKLDLVPMKLYRKKIKTLLIPFLFFNVVYYLAQYGIEYYTGWAPLASLVEKTDLLNWNYLFSYSGPPLNVALHFLRDLFVLVLLAPVFGYFMRHVPLLGLAIVVAVFMPDLDGHLVNRNTMPVLFYIGGMAAVGGWNLKRFDYLAIPMSAVLVGVCIATIYFHVDDYVYIYLTAPFAVWPASSLLVNTRVGNWAVKYSKYSFFLFLAHSPLIRVTVLLRSKYGADLAAGEYIVLSFIFIVALVPLVYNLAVQLTPKTFGLLTGGRVNTARPAPRVECLNAGLANPEVKVQAQL